MKSSKLKIGIISLSSGDLGDMIRIEKFMEALRKFDFDVRLINPYLAFMPNRGGRAHQTRLNTIIPELWQKVSILPGIRRYSIEKLAYDSLSLMLTKKLYNMIKREKFNLLQAETFMAADVTLPVKESLGIPMIFDLHSGFFTNEIKSTIMPSQKFINYWSEKEHRILKSADHIIVTSRSMGEELKKNFGLKNLSLIPNGADPWSGYRSPHGFPLKVIYSGLFAHWERICDYLDATKLVSGNDFEFYITGDGFQKRDILAKISREKMPVKYLGCLPRAKFRKLLSHMHIGVATWTKDEVFKYYSSTKTYEYLSMGMPVVCADAGEWADAVKDCECGLVVPPEDPHAFAEAIQAYRDIALWEKHSDNGLKFISHQWSWDKILSEIQPIYTTIKIR